MEARELWSWIGMVLAIGAFLQGVFPSEYRDNISSWFRRWTRAFSPYIYFVIPEFEDGNQNELYINAREYLSSLTAEGAQVSSISQPKNQKSITFSLANDQRILDTFNDVSVVWHHRSRERNQVRYINESSSDEFRSFKMKVPRAAKDNVLKGYFPYISAIAKEIQRANRDLQLYTNNKAGGTKWGKVPFSHPSTFETLALDPELKASIEEDLDEFVAGEEFYRRVGKVWKRGYLLFGPPGTGKSSMIAAMANKLHYDIYDLELTEVESNAALRKLLIRTSNKSIIVIEDIDCSLDLSGQRKKKQASFLGEIVEEISESVPKPDKHDPSRVTLSGLLNFTDGLWSCCGSQRIFVFTTNFVKKLDPALLRPGRMDMHIKLTYCTFPAFKILARNFLQIQEHPLFSEVEREFEGSFMTPAEIAEILTKQKRIVHRALQSVIKALRANKLKPRPPQEELEDVVEDVESEKEILQDEEIVE